MDNNAEEKRGPERSEGKGPVEQKKEEPKKEAAESEKEEPKKEEPKKEEKKKPTKEEKTVCAKCGKKLKEKSLYYRNGKYYCNKRCWRQAKKKNEAENLKKDSAQDQGKG